MTDTCPICARLGIPINRCPHQVGSMGGVTPVADLARTTAAVDRDVPRFLRRLVFGLVCVFGLFAGVDHLLMAVSISISAERLQQEQVLIGILLGSCLVSSLIAGTANRYAELTGLLIGILAAFGHLWQLNRTAETLPAEWFFGFPLMAGFVGLLAGFAGRLIYPPAPKVQIWGASNYASLVTESKAAEPIRWLNLIVSIVLAITGVYFADELQQHFSRIVAAKFGSFGGNGLVIWQMTTVIVCLASIISGVNSRAGMRQGLMMGIVVSLAITGLYFQLGSTRPLGAEFWQAQLDLSSTAPQIYLVLIVYNFVLCAVGGWLGAQMFPPK